MKPKGNPFHLKGYHGAALFCDREEETKLLVQNAQNSVNTTLISARRMGKTGLIRHAFSALEQTKNWNCIYVDVFATQSLAEFTNELASAILLKFPQNNSIGKKFIQFIKGFSTIISYDAYTGVPEVSFNYTQPQQPQQSLKGLFAFLEEQNKPIVLAIDEFQQIAKYPEKNTEAILRTIVQTLTNIVFIFSGSHKHLLLEMFNNAKRPFYASTQTLSLGEIAKSAYTEFIKRQFLLHQRTIDEESVDFILNWTRVHTYYTQALCNKIFAQNTKKNTINGVYNACDSLLQQQEDIFYQYRLLLTPAQWKLLKAIAKEDKVFQPTGTYFVSTYQLGNPASVRRSLEALVQKEMVYNRITAKDSYYQVYDCFLSRWLER